METKYRATIGDVSYASDDEGRGVYVSPAINPAPRWRQIQRPDETPAFRSVDELRSWVDEHCLARSA
jgi:hypothetical protein